MTLETMCEEGVDAKEIEVCYLLMDVVFPYNIILDRPTINVLGAIISTLYLVMKYPLPDGRVGMIRGDQLVTQECYKNSLR